VADNNRPKRSSRADRLIPTSLIVLTAVPFTAGVVRLMGLARGADITPDNARFFASPWPVVIHIVAVSLYCLVGAFQFAPGYRRRKPTWHRLAGWLVVPCGLVSALSGLWMTAFYPLPPALQGNLLWGFRIFIGSGMVLCLCLGLATALHRDFSRHRAWMIRGYAIGQGAGTQVLTLAPWALTFGQPVGLTRDLLMIAAWIINLAVAEWIIRRHPAPQNRTAPLLSATRSR
jgi:hypothetical protein